MLVDSHCHLNFPDFGHDLDDVVGRAKSSGVGVMQTICTKMAEFDEVHGIAKKYEGIYCSVGVHPNNTERAKKTSAKELMEKAAYEKVIGIGETGLDYHYKNTDKELQKQNFIAHIEAGRLSGLPLIVHSRDADEDTVRLLRSETEKGAFKFLIHCFSSTAYLAEEAVRLGGYISLSGIITFKNSKGLREAVATVPLERLLVETDAPYLAPDPHRGKRNEPSFTLLINQSLSAIKAISEERCARITTENFFRLFTKAKHP